MADNRLKSIVIVGGGTAGWMAAAALVDRFGTNRHTRITLVESPEIGTVGVGEATVPHIRDFLKQLKINEVDFVKRTSGTFKLAIGFEGWAGEGSRFFHPFSEHGVPLLGTSFQHYWVKLREMGRRMTSTVTCCPPNSRALGNSQFRNKARTRDFFFSITRCTSTQRWSRDI